MIDDDDKGVWTPPRPRWFRVIVIALLILIGLSIVAMVAGLLLSDA